MPTEPANTGDKLFNDLLTAAITRGQQPQRTTGLGPETLRAIEAVARAHPEAAPRQIIAAHEAFATGR